jgi:hypothetical protein
MKTTCHEDLFLWLLFASFASALVTSRRKDLELPQPRRVSVHVGSVTNLVERQEKESKPRPVVAGYAALSSTRVSTNRV